MTDRVWPGTESSDARLPDGLAAAEALRVSRATRSPRGLAGACKDPKSWHQGTAAVGGWRSPFILVVEDDASLRAGLVEVLTRAGFGVVGAACAEEAIATVEREHRDVDILVTDVVLPGMSGHGLVYVLSRANPDLKVLYMSGHGDAARVRRGQPVPEHWFLTKPFDRDAFLNRILALIAQQVEPFGAEEDE
jgi:FixJ family two-component response regulator